MNFNLKTSYLDIFTVFEFSRQNSMCESKAEKFVIFSAKIQINGELGIKTSSIDIFVPPYDNKSFFDRE